MKQIKLLTILIVLFFVGVASRDLYAGFSDAWNEQPTVPSGDLTVSLNVRTVNEQMCDSVYNASLGRMVRTIPDSLRVGVDMSDLDLIFGFAQFPVAICCIYAFFCMVNLIMRVLRGRVFVPENVRAMRLFIYSMIVFEVLKEVQLYMSYALAVSQIRPETFVVKPYFLQASWGLMLLLALFTEIFAAGVKIKEEQDLTV